VGTGSGASESRPQVSQDEGTRVTGRTVGNLSWKVLSLDNSEPYLSLSLPSTDELGEYQEAGVRGSGGLGLEEGVPGLPCFMEAGVTVSLPEWLGI
jgi:hypothetical protein